MHVEEKTEFSMYTLIVQSEEEYGQLTEIEKEQAVVLTALQKEIRQLVKRLDKIQLHNKK